MTETTVDVLPYMPEDKLPDYANDFFALVSEVSDDREPPGRLSGARIAAVPPGAALRGPPAHLWPQHRRLQPLRKAPSLL